jgi:hypothetical protein
MPVGCWPPPPVLHLLPVRTYFLPYKAGEPFHAEEDRLLIKTEFFGEIEQKRSLLTRESRAKERG